MVAPDRDRPPPPPSNNVNRNHMSIGRLPSRHFCETGELEPGERYHPDIHNAGETPHERCAEFYQDYVNVHSNRRQGGKRKTNKRRQNKKSRKNSRKSRRHRR